MSSEFQVIVVGGGVAGCAAALRAAQYNLRVAWVRGDKKTAKRSRAQWVYNIDNMIGIHDGIVVGKVLKRLRGPAFAEARAALEEHHFHISTRDIVKNTAERLEEDFPESVTFVDEAATKAHKADSGFVVSTPSGELVAPYLVLATGVMDRQPLIKKTKGDAIVDAPKWVYPFANRESVLYCIRCEGHLTLGTKVAVIGHGEAAAQLAMMLHERYGSACAVLTNGEEPGWKTESNAVLDAYGVSRHRERIVDMTGDKGELRSILLEGGGEVPVRFALVSLGLYRVYNDLARELGATLTDEGTPDDERHVLIDARGETSVADLFAVGDMTRREDEGVMKQVYTSQEYAVRAVDRIDRRIRMAKRKAALGG